MQIPSETKEDFFTLTSSIKDEIWHPKANPKAFEWWYFDALSDDGRQAVVVIFFDNFVFSPRYGASPKESESYLSEKALHFFAFNKKQSANESLCRSVPAVAFIYYQNGKPCYRFYNEYLPEEFSARENVPNCLIGKNNFRFEKAPYGSGYTVSINANLPKNLSLEAHFEWLSIESDFFPAKDSAPKKGKIWNVVAPRSDVTGRITVSETGKNRDIIHFRGSGYHDHSSDNRQAPESINRRQKGRAHFADATAVFCRYSDDEKNISSTKLCVVKDDRMHEFNAEFREENFLRDKFGIKYPSLLTLTSDDEVKLMIKQNEVADSNFFFLRFLSEAELYLKDSPPQKTVCITEHIEPKMLKYRWLNYISDMRIGRNGKPAFFS